MVDEHQCDELRYAASVFQAEQLLVDDEQTERLRRLARRLYDRMRERGDLAVMSTGWWRWSPTQVGPRRHFVLDRPASLLPEGSEQTRKADPGHE